ncbi:hypothetical protein [Idiomarina sp.]|uniref:hypothetical protein n=1 Tax=Idiomarina sp. TaxID=1874361 RepID=UPI00258DF1F1|nr:hypothetical protein [Idiomarina sp.]
MKSNEQVDKLSSWIWFRVALIAPLVGSVVLWLIAKPWNYDCSFTFEGYKYAYDLFYVPIVLAGLALSLSLLAGLVHRSYQTAESLKIAREANVFQDALRHREMFMDELASNLPNGLMDGWNLGLLYRDLFPKLLEKNYKPVIRAEWKNLAEQAEVYSESFNWYTEMVSELSSNQDAWFDKMDSRSVNLLRLIERTYYPYRGFPDMWDDDSPSDSEELHAKLEKACEQVAKRFEEFTQILSVIRASFINYFIEAEFASVVDTIRHKELRFHCTPDPLFDDESSSEFNGKYDWAGNDKTLLISASLCFDDKYKR